MNDKLKLRGYEY